MEIDMKNRSTKVKKITSEVEQPLLQRPVSQSKKQIKMMEENNAFSPFRDPQIKNNQRHTTMLEPSNFLNRDTEKGIPPKNRGASFISTLPSQKGLIDRNDSKGFSITG